MLCVYFVFHARAGAVGVMTTHIDDFLVCGERGAPDSARFRAHWHGGAPGQILLSDNDPTEVYGCATIYPQRKEIAGLEITALRDGKYPEASM